MANTGIPKFKTYANGDPIPPIDPEDLKRFWHVKQPWLPGNVESACSHGADVAAVSQRRRMISTLIAYKLLAPWQHGEELDDAVFRVAATFPLRELKQQDYMIPGDERFGFDPNAFVQKLIEETGIYHVWEPVPTKVSSRCFVTVDFTLRGEVQVPNPERQAKHAARELAWNIWKRFSPSLDQVIARSDKEEASYIVATLFADFLMDNMDLISQIEAGYRTGNGGGGSTVWGELERRAQGWPGLHH